jgi:hypothetical protein
MSVRVIGILGSKGAGKDTFASLAKKLLTHRPGDDGVQVTHFAAPLKEAAQIIFDLSHAQMHNPKHKEVVDPRWDKTPRQLMQLLGTEVGRSIDPQVWVKNLRCRIEGDAGVRLWLVPDVWFANEAEMIRSIGGKLVRVSRPGYDGDGHASETEQRSIEADATIMNVGDLVRLEEATAVILRDFGLR